jgi:hypothetical protein
LERAFVGTAPESRLLRLSPTLLRVWRIPVRDAGQSVFPTLELGFVATSRWLRGIINASN